MQAGCWHFNCCHLDLLGWMEKKKTQRSQQDWHKGNAYSSSICQSCAGAETDCSWATWDSPRLGADPNLDLLSIKAGDAVVIVQGDAAYSMVCCTLAGLQLSALQELAEFPSPTCHQPFFLPLQVFLEWETGVLSISYMVQV